MLEFHPSNKKFFDELFFENCSVRDYYSKLFGHVSSLSDKSYKAHNEHSKVSFFNQGITFAVYDEKKKGIEKIFPFDLFPRLITKKEWEKIEKGAIQRNLALNLFLKDIYSKKQILKDGVFPSELLFSCAFYLKEMQNLTPPADIFIHIAGTDLIRHSDGDFYVLEDNLRSPSGVSYVLTNRIAMQRSFPNLFNEYSIEPVAEYPEQLLKIMRSLAKSSDQEPVCVLLTPGIYNSAYFEHAYLANQMGIELVEGRDLFVDKGYVYMKTIDGAVKVDVIYRRIDDEFLDPMVFSKESMLGIAGVMGVYREGNVALINAPGTGAADDKAIYAYVPDIIKYYLNEEPILNNVPTYRCDVESELKYVCEHLDGLVIKPVDASGGYGLFFGHTASKQEKEAQIELIKSNGRKYIAQPILNLSTHPTYISERARFEPRHIDLRTFTLMGNDMSFVLKGGLTRVALKEGNLVVNSSQGGGSKDTWILGA